MLEIILYHCKTILYSLINGVFVAIPCSLAALYFSRLPKLLKVLTWIQRNLYCHLYVYFWAHYQRKVSIYTHPSVVNCGQGLKRVYTSNSGECLGRPLKIPSLPCRPPLKICNGHPFVPLNLQIAHKTAILSLSDAFLILTPMSPNQINMIEISKQDFFHGEFNDTVY